MENHTFSDQREWLAHVSSKTGIPVEALSGDSCNPDLAQGEYLVELDRLISTSIGSVMRGVMCSLVRAKRRKLDYSSLLMRPGRQ